MRRTVRLGALLILACATAPACDRGAFEQSGFAGQLGLLPEEDSEIVMTGDVEREDVSADLADGAIVEWAEGGSDILSESGESPVATAVIHGSETLAIRCVVSCHAVFGPLRQQIPSVSVDVPALESVSVPVVLSSAYEVDPAQYDYVTSLDCIVRVFTAYDEFIDNRLLEPRFLAIGADSSYEVLDSDSVAETYPLGIIDAEKAAQAQAMIDDASPEEGILAGVGPEVYLFEPAASLEE